MPERDNESGKSRSLLSKMFARNAAKRAPRQPEAITVSQIVRMRLEPGDMVAVTVPGRLSQEACARIKRAFDVHLPDGVKMIMLQEGMQLSVLSSARDDEQDHLVSQHLAS